MFYVYTSVTSSCFSSSSTKYYLFLSVFPALCIQIYLKLEYFLINLPSKYLYYLSTSMFSLGNDNFPHNKHYLIFYQTFALSHANFLLFPS